MAIPCGNEMKELSHIAVCPQCQGSRLMWSLKHHKLVECETCKPLGPASRSVGWVPNSVCRGCGKPAYKFWPPNQIPIIKYCGMETCFNALVRVIAAPKAKPVVQQADDDEDGISEAWIDFDPSVGGKIPRL